MSKVNASDGTGTKEVLLKLCCRPGGIPQSRRPLTMPSRLDLTPEEKAERRRQRQAAHQRAYAERNRANPEYLERRAAHQRAYQERKKDDPEYLARRAELTKKHNNSDAARAARKRYLEKEGNKEKAKQGQLRWKRSERGREARKDQKRRYLERIRAKAAAMLPPMPIKARLLTNELYAAADAAVPRNLPEFARDDVIADICLAVLSGEFTINDIPKSAKPIISKGWQAISKFGHMSLDSPRFEDGKRTLHDTISVGLWDDGSDEEVEAQP